jgi:hypothetical protein
MSSPPGTRILSPGWKRLSGWAPGSCWERLAKHRMAPAATTRQHAEPALVTPAHGMIVLCIPASQRQEGSGRRLLAGPWSAIAGKLSLSLQQLQKAADYFTDLSHDYSSSLSEGADAVGCTPGVGSTRRAEIRWLWLNAATWACSHVGPAACPFYHGGSSLQAPSPDTGAVTLAGIPVIVGTAAGSFNHPAVSPSCWLVAQERTGAVYSQPQN